MFWAKKPKISDFEKLRQRQIEEFVKACPHAKLLPRLPDTYAMTVDTKFGPLVFHIFLPTQFPELAPTIKLQARVVHHWVDQDMVVTGHPKLVNWGVHVHLGSLVKEIHAEFMQNPPMPAQALTSKQPPPIAAKPAHVSARSSERLPGLPAKNVRQKSEDEVLHTPQPKIPSTFPELESKSIEELEDLCASPFAITDMTMKMASVRSMKSFREELYDGIEDLATRTMARKEEYDELTVMITSLKEELRSVKTAYDKMASKKDAMLSQYSLASILKLLDAAIEQEEDASDALRAQYKANDESDDDSDGAGKEEATKLSHSKFCKQYIKARKKTHDLAAKRELLTETYGVAR